MENIILNKKGKFLEFIIALLLVLIGVCSRIFFHPFNFTPIAAIALFGGVYFSKKIALILPLAVMAISDLFIGYYDFKLMVSVYGSFLLCVILGFLLKKNKKWYTIFGSSLLASFIFFFLTNFAVWAFYPWYAKTFFGVIECFSMALPFFKNTILGDVFYVTIFFGVYEVVEFWIRKKFQIKNFNRELTNRVLERIEATDYKRQNPNSYSIHSK